MVRHDVSEWGAALIAIGSLVWGMSLGCTSSAESDEETARELAALDGVAGSQAGGAGGSGGELIVINVGGGGAGASSSTGGTGGAPAQTDQCDVDPANGVCANIIRGDDAAPGTLYAPTMHFLSGMPEGEESLRGRGHYAFHHGPGASSHSGQSAAEVHYFGSRGREIIGLDNGFMADPSDPEHALYWRYQSANHIGLRFQSSDHLSMEARGFVNIEANGSFIQLIAGSAIKRIMGNTITVPPNEKAPIVTIPLRTSQLVHVQAVVVELVAGSFRASYERTCTALGDATSHILHEEAPYNAENGAEIEWATQGTNLLLMVGGNPESAKFSAIVEIVSVTP
ncbi:MAG: hypothetical protein U0271_34735 [Polyangiaceae bacterium]